MVMTEGDRVLSTGSKLLFFPIRELVTTGGSISDR